MHSGVLIGSPIMVFCAIETGIVRCTFWSGGQLGQSGEWIVVI